MYQTKKYNLVKALMNQIDLYILIVKTILNKRVLMNNYD